MRKWIVSFMLLFFLVVLFFSSYAETATVKPSIPTRESLETLSVEELLSLQSLISAILEEKGYELYVEIAHGDKGEHVTRLQTRLKELGYYTGRISGKYDNLTEKAVKAFQKENGLPSSSTATQEMQSLLYSSTVGSPTAAPKPSSTPTPTTDPTFSEYIEINYQELARNPEKHIGEKVVFTGSVLQVIGTKESNMTVRLGVGGGNVVYLNIHRGIVDFNILESDRLTVYATMKGLKTYTSTFNQSITIPQADANYIILK